MTTTFRQLAIFSLAFASHIAEMQKRLCLAARNGNFLELNGLFEEPAINLNWRPPEEDDLLPALAEAIIQKNIDMAKLLLEHSADPNIVCSTSGWRPLSYALKYGSDDMLLLLVRHNVDPDFTYVTQINNRVQVENHGWNHARLLIEPIFSALVASQLELVKAGNIDLSKRSKVDGWSLLDRITIFGTAAQLREAMALGADPNSYHHKVARTRKPFQQSSKEHKQMEQLVEPPLVLLCRYPRYPAEETRTKIELLVANGADINLTVDMYSVDGPVSKKAGRTALWYACKNGYHSVIPTLLRLGAAISTADARSMTPLHCCCRDSKFESFLLLLRELYRLGLLNEQLKISTIDGLTPLDYCMLNCKHLMIKVLFLLGEKPTIKENLAFSTRIASLSAIWANEINRQKRIAVMFGLATSSFQPFYMPSELRKIIFRMFIEIILDSRN